MHWEHKASEFIGNALYIIESLDLRHPGQDLILTPVMPTIHNNVLKNIIVLASTNSDAYINASNIGLFGVKITLISQNDLPLYISWPVITERFTKLLKEVSNV